jgi:hypothetical protein
MTGRKYQMHGDQHGLNDASGKLLLTLYKIGKQIQLEKKTTKKFYFI